MNAVMNSIIIGGARHIRADERFKIFNDPIHGYIRVDDVRTPRRQLQVVS